MGKSFTNILQGYDLFRKKYVLGDTSVMQTLSYQGQQPEIMVIACCDSRVDPALIFQCSPGDLFVVRNVANIVPPFEKDEAHHGTSAALEFGIRFLNIDHLILFGHSQCGGIQALLEPSATTSKNDFIDNWVSLITPTEKEKCSVDDYAKLALHHSYKNCLTFPWLEKKLKQNELSIHRWFFDIKSGQIFAFSEVTNQYHPLGT